MVIVILFFFFKQKTAYEMRISDWSSDVCSSDLTNATVAENLMFGTARNGIYQDDNLARDPHILSVLDMVGLRRRFLEIGHEVASTMVELFADLPPDHEFFQQFSFIASADLPDYKDLLLRSRPDALDQLPEAARVRVMSLPFNLVMAQLRLGHFAHPHGQ